MTVPVPPPADATFGQPRVAAESNGDPHRASRTIELYDTTLRDGAQQEGISLSVEDKLAITKLLDQLGIDIIEGGYAGANPKDDEYFQRVRELDLQHAAIAAFGNTRHAGTDCAADASMAALLASGAPILTLVGKASTSQVREVLETTVEENLAMISDSVRYLTTQGRRVFFDAEHFFDGYKQDPDYAIQSLRAALSAGAERLVLCDTNGGTLPHEVAQIVAEVHERLREDGLADHATLGIHAHNDTDTAVASTIEAVRAGVHQVQGCINGYGERTGNANLISVIGNLSLKLGLPVVDADQLASLTSVANLVSEIANRRPSPFQPYVGISAFAHKGGLHASATAKSGQSYQHIDPAIVGNGTRVTVSELAGRSNVLQLIRRMGVEELLLPGAERDIVAEIKRREAAGYAYERAVASQEVLVRHRLSGYQRPFVLVDYAVTIEKNGRKSYGTGWRDDESAHTVLSEATLKVRVNGSVRTAYAEGNGPVDALNRCLRDALHEHYPEVASIELTDYKVRVVNETVGTGAAVRVEIESAADGVVWHTVGASTNIIQASWEALADSVEWWLNRDGDDGVDGGVAEVDTPARVELSATMAASDEAGDAQSGENTGRRGLKITKPWEQEPVEHVVILIYGKPGVGKSTLARTARNPLVLDFGDTQDDVGFVGVRRKVTDWSEVAYIEGLDLGDHSTLIIDDLGEAQQTLIRHLGRSIRTTRPDGRLTSSCHGALGYQFSLWIDGLRSLNADIVLLAEDYEFRKDGQLVNSIAMTGWSRNEALAVSDSIGILAVDERGRSLSFQPSESVVGRNPAQLPVLRLPGRENMPGYLSEVIDQVKNAVCRNVAVPVKRRRTQS